MHQVRDSNGPALLAALDEWGYDQATCCSVSDEPYALRVKLARLVGRWDVVVVTGGVSVGKYDFVKDAIERVGAAVRFHGVAMKPGKPLLYATLPGNRHVFGLPGNPLSVMTGFHEFVLPALRIMSGFPRTECRPRLQVKVDTPVAAHRTRDLYVVARLAWQEDGPHATAIRSCGSGDVASGGRADGVIVVPVAARDLQAGAVAEFRPWRALP
jgi:molybdopterin molybdotransferase